MKYSIGIDLGGTHFRIAIIDSKGQIKIFEKVKTPKSAKELLALVKTLSHKLLSELSLDIKKDIIGVGFCIGAPIDSNDKVKWGKKYGYGNFDIKIQAKKVLQKQIYIENDLTAAAEAELKFGSLKGCKNGMIITASTGIGSGIIVDGRLYRGATLSAGEIGHAYFDLNTELHCSMGHKGCFEALASGTAAEKRYKSMVGRKKTAKEIVGLAQEGDKFASKVLNDVAFWLGIGLANAANIINPEIITIHGSFFLAIWNREKKLIKKVFNDRALSKTEIRLTTLGDHGGMIGAGNLAFQG